MRNISILIISRTRLHANRFAQTISLKWTDCFVYRHVYAVFGYSIRTTLIVWTPDPICFIYHIYTHHVRRKGRRGFYYFLCWDINVYGRRWLLSYAPVISSPNAVVLLLLAHIHFFVFIFHRPSPWITNTIFIMIKSFFGSFDNLKNVKKSLIIPSIFHPYIPAAYPTNFFSECNPLNNITVFW